MRVHLVSDLHLDHASWVYPEVKADVTVLAGDLSTWSRRGQVETLIRDVTAQRPCLVVLGNHDYWGTTRPQARDWMLDLSGKYPGLHLLDDGWVDLDGVRFCGSSLWTDFALNGDPEGAMELVMRLPAGQGRTGPMPDFAQQRDATPARYQQWHWAARRALELGIQGHARVCCVTHWVPVPEAINPRYRGDALNPYFITDCRDLIRPQVKAWLFGHTHSPYDQVLEGTRFVCNPRGYPGEPTGFNPNLIVEIP